LTITGPAKDASFIHALYSLLHADLPKEIISAQAGSKIRWNASDCHGWVQNPTRTRHLAEADSGEKVDGGPPKSLPKSIVQL
jgi:hypothetical protein